VAERCGQRLIQAFGTLAAVLAAPRARRDELLAGEPAVARHLTAVRAAMLHALEAEAVCGPRIAGTDELAAYLRADLGYQPAEQLRILFLAPDNRLLCDEVVARGSIDTIMMLPRPIVHRALDLGAKGLILVHNHPAGSPEPSRADLSATRELVSVCRPLEIIVHDHLIVAKGGWSSLRLMGLL
jgi:DNA repair protein RadC